MKKRSVPLAQINLLINVDRTDDPSGKAGRASRTFDTMDAGAGARNALELADAIDFHGLHDYLSEDDLRQSAELVAWVLYRASNEP